MIDDQVKKLWRRRAIHPAGSGKLYKKRMNLDRNGKRIYSGMHGVWDSDDIIELGTMVWDRSMRDWVFVRDGASGDRGFLAPFEYNHLNRIAVYQYFSADTQAVKE